MSKEAIYQEAIRLMNKWGDENEGATDEELEALERTLELAIADVQETLRNRKEDTQSEDALAIIHEWKELDAAKAIADDYTRCPRCNEQLYFCNCTEELGDKLLLNHADFIITKIQE